MVAVAATVAALTLPLGGVAVQHGDHVTLLRYDGTSVRTLHHWRIDTRPSVPRGSVLLRGPARAPWLLAHGRLRRLERPPRFVLADGCFATGGGLRICGKPYGRGPSRVVAGESVVARAPEEHGHWLSVDVSATGRMLAQWSGICETPIAYFLVPLRPTGGRAYESFAVGWAGERPIVQYTSGVCTTARPQPGLYVGESRIRGYRLGDVAVAWR